MNIAPRCEAPGNGTAAYALAGLSHLKCMPRIAFDRPDKAASFGDVRAVADKLVEITAGFNAKSASLEADKRELQARLSTLEQEVAKRGGGDGGYHAGTTLGDLVVRHKDFNAVSELASVRGRKTLKIQAQISSLPDSAGALIVPDRAAPVPLLQRKLTVRDLVSVGRTDSSSVQYARQNLRTIAASVVTEGAQKPESALGFELKSASVATIAHWLKCTRQALSDAKQLRTVIDNELRYGLKYAEEQQVLFGDGTGVNMLGIVPQATAYHHEFVAANHTQLDDLRLGMLQAELALLPASGIVLHPVDASRIATLKSSTGEYLSAGPFGSDYDKIWGLPVARSMSMPQGAFLVGAFKEAVTLFDREEISVEVATEHSTDFTANLCTILCEERCALVVTRPEALIYGSFIVTT
ncbi:phage major capsid protein [soil metagenome]